MCFICWHFLQMMSPTSWILGTGAWRPMPIWAWIPAYIYRYIHIHIHRSIWLRFSCLFHMLTFGFWAREHGDLGQFGHGPHHTHIYIYIYIYIYIHIYIYIDLGLRCFLVDGAAQPVSCAQPPWSTVQIRDEKKNTRVTAHKAILRAPLEGHPAPFLQNKGTLSSCLLLIHEHLFGGKFRGPADGKLWWGPAGATLTM
jgi:hypothetical protein